MKYRIILLASLVALGAGLAYSDNTAVQSQLMDIAAQEAQIANIGANKYMMLYGKNNVSDRLTTGIHKRCFML